MLFAPRPDVVMGYLIAFVLPLALAFWPGYQQLKQEELAEEWPPPQVPAHDKRVVRMRLRQLGVESERAGGPRWDEILPVVRMFLDDIVPHVCRRRDRSFWRWLREVQPRSHALELLWALVAATLFVAATFGRVRLAMMVGGVLGTS